VDASIDCPDLECWQALFREDVPAERWQAYECHLEACAVCRQRLRAATTEASEDDAWRQLGQRLGDPTVAPTDPTLLEVVQRLQQVQATAAPELSVLQPSQHTDLLGTLGAYEVQEVIGQGGMGIVLKALEPALQRTVAIKILSPNLAGSATARRRFTREARAAAAIRHEHVVAVYGVQEADGLPYLVMQHIAGESLQDRLDRCGPLALDDVVRLGYQAACGLAAAHEQGLIHRDIKPANILLERVAGGVWRVAGQDPDAPSSPATLHPPPFTRIKITDFGLARAIDDIGLTQNGVVAGTPAYMSPEQARGEPLDQRADLFSLGSVLYAACSGVAPFGGTATLEILRQVSEQSPAPLRTLRPDIPAWLEALIARLMANDPDDRFQSAAEVVQALQAGDGPRKMTASTRWPGRLLAGGLCLTLLAGVFIFAQQPPGPAQRAEPMEFSCDLRGKPPPPELTWLNAEEGKFFRFEPEGLRITLPDSWAHPWGGVGLRTAFGFGGDFEVTAAFEILDAERPPGGFGVGVGIALSTGKVEALNQNSRDASFSRLQRASGNQMLLWNQSVLGRETNKIGWPEGSVPCTDTVLHLRLKRTGTTLSFQWAPGATGADFTELHRSEFGSEDIGRLRFTAITGQRPCKLDVRLLSLQIRSQTGDRPTVQVRPPGRKLWLLLALGIALTAGLALALRRRSPGRDTRGQAADQPARAVRRRGKWHSAAILVLVLSGAMALVVFVVVRRALPPISYLDQAFGAQPLQGINEEGMYAQDFSPTLNEPFRFTDGAAKFVVPLHEHAPQAIQFRLGVTMPRPVPLCLKINGQTLFEKQVDMKLLWSQTFDLARFNLGKAMTIEILSDTFVPAQVQPGSTDGRTLGICVRGITLCSGTQDFTNVPLGVRAVAGVAEEGFRHELEKAVGQPCRWSEGHAKLIVPVRAKTPRALALMLQIPDRPNYRLKVLVNGRSLFDDEVAPSFGWTIELPLDAAALGERAVIELVSSTFVPAEVDAGSKDDRKLGVRVRRLILLADDDANK
jgi:serine/threonine protein kinase